MQKKRTGSKIQDLSITISRTLTKDFQNNIGKRSMKRCSKNDQDKISKGKGEGE